MERSPFISIIKIEAREKGYKVFLCRDNLIPYYEEGIKPTQSFLYIYTIKETGLCQKT